MAEANWIVTTLRDGTAAYGPATEAKLLLPPGRYSVQESMSGWMLRPEVERDDHIEPTAQFNRVLAEVEKFYDSASVYQQYGRSHKRGLLLYGEPGTGKTTIMRALARVVLARGGYVLSGLSDNTPAAVAYLSKVHPDSPKMLTLDEIDEYFDEGALLRFLDGQEKLSNVLTCATTNSKLASIEPKLLRPGRFDMLISVGTPDLGERQAFFMGLGAPELISHSAGMTVASMNELFVSTRILGKSVDEVVRALKGE